MTYEKSVKNGLIHPELVVKIEELYEKCKQKGIMIKFSEGFRTVEEQNELYAQGRTKPGHIVTNAKGNVYSSQHQWGIAADFYLDMDVDGDGDKKDDAFNDSTSLFISVGDIARSINLGWGGKWKTLQDKPHLYLPYWGNTPGVLFSEYGSFEEFRKTWSTGKEVYKDTDSTHTGKDYKLLQYLLNVTQDGIPGPITLAATPTLKDGSKGGVVKWVQDFLNWEMHCKLKVDGIYGPKTKQTVAEYQCKNDLGVIDGIMDSGKNTWRCVLGLYHKK